MAQASNQLFIITGPSCVGKTPLVRSLRRFYPDCMNSMAPVMLYNSRRPRPGEEDGVDYYFRDESRIRELCGNDQYIVRKVRNDWQALDVEELKQLLKNQGVLYEGNPDFASILMTNPALSNVPRNGMFISPLCREEIIYLKQQPDIDLKTFLSDLMYGKQRRRFQRQKGSPGPVDLRDMKTRAQCAYPELKSACVFNCVVANHDGEDSEHWDVCGYPIGEARKTMRAAHEWLQGKYPPGAEHFETGLLP